MTKDIYVTLGSNKIMSVTYPYTTHKLRRRFKSY